MNTKNKVKKNSFTLIELMIVIAIMALVAFLYPSSWKKDKSDAIKRCAMEMENVAMAVKIYKLNHANYPGNAGQAQPVPELVGFVDEDFCFSNEPPVGGTWKFHTQSSAKGYIQIFKPTLSEDDMTRLDAFIDDGNLKTGEFVKVGQHYDYQIWNNK